LVTARSIHSSSVLCLSSLLRPAPRSTLFPYTPLFRSWSRTMTVASLVPYLAYSAIGDARILAPTPLLVVHGTRDAALLPEYAQRSEEHTSELQSRENLVCRLLLEKKKQDIENRYPCML